MLAAVGMLRGPRTELLKLVENETSVRQHEMLIMFVTGLMCDPQCAKFMEHLDPVTHQLDPRAFLEKLAVVFDPLQLFTVIYESQRPHLVDLVPEVVEFSNVFPSEMMSICWVLKQQECRIFKVNLTTLRLDNLLLRQLFDGLAQNKSVQELDLSCNEDLLATVGASRAFCAALESMTSLRQLSLRECDLTPQALVVISAGLHRGCSQLESLDLCGNRRSLSTVEAGRKLGAALESLKKLSILHLDNCGLTPQSFIAVSAGLSQRSHQLCVLSLYHNEGSLETVEAGTQLSATLQSLTALRELYLHGCGLTPLSLTAMSIGLRRGCHQIQRLDLSINYGPLSTVEAGRALGAAFESTTTLRELNLNRCGLTPESVIAVSAGLRCGGRQLEVLRLSNNDGSLGTVEAGRYLGAALRSMTTLRELDLNRCGLNPETLIAVSSTGFSRTDHQLEVLRLSNNEGSLGTVEAVRHLGATLRSMTTLCELDLEGCGLTIQSLAIVSDGLGREDSHLLLVVDCDLSTEHDHTYEEFVEDLDDDDDDDDDDDGDDGDSFDEDSFDEDSFDDNKYDYTYALPPRRR
ncbi:hypothetical protein LSAT2_008778 [Lamellibrachia satsuma]|nr:hypothetical protein LSAT2_008778 [Lamellibrachia satsuma]